MSDPSLCLKPINDLLGEQFCIPAYQRGYRWTPQQVTDLLDDLDAFLSRNTKEDGEFYCLQPVVVMARRDGSWELIDGQQRLTTLYLIMAALRVQMAAHVNGGGKM